MFLYQVTETMADRNFKWEIKWNLTTLNWFHFKFDWRWRLYPDIIGIRFNDVVGLYVFKTNFSLNDIKTNINWNFKKSPWPPFKASLFQIGLSALFNNEHMRDETYLVVMVSSPGCCLKCFRNTWGHFLYTDVLLEWVDFSIFKKTVKPALKVTCK